MNFGSGNGLSPVRFQAITSNNAAVLSNKPFGTNFSEVLIEIIPISLKKALQSVIGKYRGHFVQGEMS